MSEAKKTRRNIADKIKMKVCDEHPELMKATGIPSDESAISSARTLLDGVCEREKIRNGNIDDVYPCVASRTVGNKQVLFVIRTEAAADVFAEEFAIKRNGAGKRPTFNGLDDIPTA